jgi:probable rRNA maturation factor
MDINFQIDEPFVTEVSQDAIARALRTTIHLTGEAAVPYHSVNIIISDDQTVHELNRQYRGIDAPTDVLSFENKRDPDFPEVDPEISNHLGDIVIACPLASAQAAAYGHRTSDEIILLVVHGALHLLGFDHDTAGNKEKMWVVQSRIMAQLNLGQVQPTEN